MHPRRLLLLVLLGSLFLAGLAPTASAQVVCESGERRFQVLQGPTDHTFDCGVFFDALVVLAFNDRTDPPLPGPRDAGFTACLVDADGTERLCQKGCGHVLFRDLAGDVSVRVHFGFPGLAQCLPLQGTVEVLFADE